MGPVPVQELQAAAGAESMRGHPCQAGLSSCSAGSWRTRSWHTRQPSFARLVTSLPRQGICKKRKNLLSFPSPLIAAFFLSSLRFVFVPEFRMGRLRQFSVGQM